MQNLSGMLSENALKIQEEVQKMPGLPVHRVREKANLGKTAFYTALRELSHSRVYRFISGRYAHLFPNVPGVEGWAAEFIFLLDLYRENDEIRVPVVQEFKDLMWEGFGWEEEPIDDLMMELEATYGLKDDERK